MKLVLEDGTELSGRGFGATRAVGGEVVFNAAMTGYIETLTDPSYRGQILLLTYPLIGNYGVPLPRLAGSIDQPYESNQIQVQGLVVQHYVDDHSHHSGVRSLHDWLLSEGVPAVNGIDTRTLTRRLREYRTMKGWLLPAGEKTEEAQQDADIVDMRAEVFRVVTPNEPIRYEGGDQTVLFIDVGAKDNIVRSLLSRGVSVLRLPWHMRLSEFVNQADGIVIGNGPGDPKDLGALVEQVRGLLDSFEPPIFGICLGSPSMPQRERQRYSPNSASSAHL